MLIWHINPVYTSIPWYHFIAEGRYRGAEVVTIAPDYSPSAIHADYYVPVRTGTDAALALAMCQVLIEEGLVPRRLRQGADGPAPAGAPGQPPLPRGQRTCDGGRDDQFYFYDSKSKKVVEAPAATLALGERGPCPGGRFKARSGGRLRGGGDPRLRAAEARRLQDYTPEKATARSAASTPMSSARWPARPRRSAPASSWAGTPASTTTATSWSGP